MTVIPINAASNDDFSKQYRKIQEDRRRKSLQEQCLIESIFRGQLISLREHPERREEYFAVWRKAFSQCIRYAMTKEDLDPLVKAFDDVVNEMLCGRDGPLHPMKDLGDRLRRKIVLLRSR